MPDYSKGKIYQVISPNHPVPYIGSTTQALSKRMVLHRRCHRTTCRIIIDAGDAYIELIEEFPCDNKEQLNKREGEVIRQMNCVNRYITGRTQKEYKETHKETQAEYQKAYRQANKEKAKAYLKQWKEDNKEAYTQQRKAYRLKKKSTTGK